MAARCQGRPREVRPGPSVGTPSMQPMGTTSSSSPHPAGAAPQATGHDPGAPPSSHPAPVPHPHPQSRPFFYVQHMPPPPPPFLQYQWPMPLPYNPFSGFPAMGYGMVMPPFPPSPYMEAPGSYMLPHLQPVDYRRFLPPQFPMATAAFQCPVPARRFHPQQTVPIARETVNSEVQTEPTRTTPAPGYAVASGEGSPVTGSESGHGTTSVSPSLSGSSAGRRGGVEIDTSSPGPDSDPRDRPASPTKLSPRSAYGGESSPATKCPRTPSRASRRRSKDDIGQKNGSRGLGSLGSHVFETWSVCSTDCMVPVCSSSDREDDAVARDRRVSFPDVLMNWSVGTPPVAPADGADKQQAQPSVRRETTPEEKKTLNRSAAEKGRRPLADEAEGRRSSYASEAHAHKILKLPFILNETLHTSRNVNESVWSVDSLLPYVPSRDWMVRNGLADALSTVPDEEPEEGDDSVPHDDSVDVNRLSLSLAPTRKKLNESVWSVESLPTYTPSHEWLMQNGIVEPDVIIEEVMDDSHDGVLSTPRDERALQMHRRRRLSRRFSLSSVESLPVYVPSASWLSEQRNVNGFNRFPLTSQCNVDASSCMPVDNASPQKKPPLECETLPPADDGQPECGMGMVVSEKDCLPGGTCAESNAATCGTVEQARDVENGSSEPEANRSPNQESVNIVEQQIESLCPPEELDIPLSNPVTRDQSCSVEQELVKCVREEAGQKLIDEELGVEMADQKLFDEKRGVEMEDQKLFDEKRGVEVADQKLIDEERWVEVADQKLFNEERGVEVADQKLFDEKRGVEIEDQKLIDEERGVEIEDQKMTTVSPVKSHMVDFGVQCSDLQECPCHCTSKIERKKCQSQILDSGRGNKAVVHEDICETGQTFPKRTGQGKNRQQEPRQHKPFTQRHWQRDIQEESYGGHNGRLGKAKGGNGKNSRY